MNNEIDSLRLVGPEARLLLLPYALTHTCKTIFQDLTQLVKQVVDSSEPGFTTTTTQIRHLQHHYKKIVLLQVVMTIWHHLTTPLQTHLTIHISKTCKVKRVSFLLIKPFSMEDPQTLMLMNIVVILQVLQLILLMQWSKWGTLILSLGLMVRLGPTAG